MRSTNTHRMGRKWTLECYVSEDLWVQRKLCNAFHFRSSVLLNHLGRSEPSRTENLLAEKGSCPEMMKMLVLTMHREFS